MVEIDITNEEDKFNCIVCFELALDPYTCMKCACLLCKECAKPEHCKSCPKCRGSTDMIFPNPSLKGMFGLLVIECKNNCGFKTKR